MATSTRVDLNTANLETLESLPGLTKAQAQKIVAYRQESGGIRTLGELANLPGWNAKLVQTIEKKVTLSHPAVQPTAQTL